MTSTTYTIVQSGAEHEVSRPHKSPEQWARMRRRPVGVRHAFMECRPTHRRGR